MKIAVDAMGGDFAPEQIVLGAVKAALANKKITKLFLVGDESSIQKELDKQSSVPACIEICHASEVIEMDESPAKSLRAKKDSSIGRSVDLVKSGEAEAVFSAGNTGAVTAAATLKLRTLEGIDRPAIATIMPSVSGHCVMCDAGANTDCTPELIKQFGIMASVYAEKILKIKNPRVGVLSIGEEEAKGNAQTKEAFELLKNTNLNFIGNVESRDIFAGNADVVACDGFVGNVVLKTSESVAKTMSLWLKQAFTKNPFRMLAALSLKGAFKEVKKQADPEAHGGAPLLGANGICIIGHGSSSAIAVQNGIRVACEEIETKLNESISAAVRENMLEVSE